MCIFSAHLLLCIACQKIVNSYTVSVFLSQAGKLEDVLAFKVPGV